jgi:lysophospholipase L1-like esterase
MPMKIKNLLAAFLSLVLVVTTAVAVELAATPAPTTTIASDDNAKRFPAWNQECLDRVAAFKGKRCDIIFIGDSITRNFVIDPAGWPLVGGPVWAKHYANRYALDFGVGADRTENVLWRLDHMDIKNLRPKVAVVLIGTNNYQNSPPDIAAGVAAVLARTKQIFPGVKIILISILPNARATQTMADANKLIQTFGDNQSVFYFDLAAKMTPVGDNWKGVGFDHLHLTPEGYELWAESMEPLLTKLLAGNN